jgi:hypothetical protein
LLKLHWCILGLNVIGFQTQYFERAKQPLVSQCVKSKDANARQVATVPAAPEKSSGIWDEFDRSVSPWQETYIQELL